MNKFLASFYKNKFGILFILFAALSTATGQLLWKLSNGDLNFFLIGGFSFYFAGALFMIIGFRFGSLSVLHPLLSIGYVFAIFLGSLFLNEYLSLKEWIGTFIIIIGAILIGGGDD